MSTAPPDQDLALDAMETTNANCLVVGDFNRDSDRWGSSDTDARGSEVEDWEIDVNLQLLNRASDTPTYYSKAWNSTSTLDLAFPLVISLTKSSARS